MDLAVSSFRRATTRDDLRLAPGEALLGGGTWLFSEPQPGVEGLVDLTTLGWPAWEPLPDGGLRLAGTCTVSQLLAVPPDALAAVHDLVRASADAFLMSFKIQHSATVGGNLALALPAGAMISLTSGLAGEVVVWTPDGGERREAVASFVTGVRSTTLRPGEVVRAVDLPAASLVARTAIRRISLTPHGRSSAVVVGRVDPDRTVLTVTAATTRPVVVDLGPAPSTAAREAELEAALARVDCWYDDPHGPADWRRRVTGELAAEVCRELDR